MIGLLAGLSVGLFLFLIHAAYTVATLRQALSEQRDAHAELVRITTEMVSPDAHDWTGRDRRAIAWADDLLGALLTLDTAERSL